MSLHVVVAYRYIGGLSVYGPYRSRGFAATAAAVKAASDEFETAYVIQLEDPDPPISAGWGPAKPSTWGEEPLPPP